MTSRIFKLMIAIVPAATALLSSAAPAQGAYPNRPVTVIVGYGAGGGADTLARLYTQRLSAALGVPFIVQNKPGAGATLATSEVARAAPDGYTLLVAPTAVFTITPHVRKVHYSPLKDFQPISMLAVGMDVIVSSKTLPTKNLGKFIALAKAHPRKYSFASSGIATSTDLMGEMFKETAGIDLLHVPYKSSSEYLPDPISGRISLAFDPILLNQVKAGKLNFMAVISDKRLAQWPDVGTTKEAGLDMSLAQNRLWYGIFAPAGVPAAVTEKLSQAVAKAAADPSLAKQLEGTGIRPASLAPDQFAAKIKDDSAYYGGLIHKLGIKLNE